MGSSAPVPHPAFEAFHDYAVPTDDFLKDLHDGLSRQQKQIPAKYFYDARGSQLFEEICRLEEYYPTRTEIALLRASGPEIAGLAGPDTCVVDFGSGSSEKAQILLEALDSPRAYVPVDISRDHLIASAAALAGAFPQIAVVPVCADYGKAFDLPAQARRPGRMGFFPGSTIGNFLPSEATAFLARLGRTLGPGSGLLIGVDLKKDQGILHAAYNDSRGITAAFNRNLLARINRETGARIDPDSFAHAAPYNADRGCIEMHLISRTAQTIEIGGRRFTFAEGESIHTEDSFKYSVAEFQTLARSAGWTSEQVWTDQDDLFSLHYLRAV